MTPTEITHYVPHPTIVLMGCRPWPPARTDPDLCPVCGPGVSERTTYCAVCDSLSPANEARVRAQRLGVRGRDSVEAAEKAHAERLTKRYAGGLTEHDVRQLWFGGEDRHYYNRGVDQVVNTARANRAWLRSIGVEPDWHTVLDGHGDVKGHHDRRLVFDDEGRPTGRLPSEAA